VLLPFWFLAAVSLSLVGKLITGLLQNKYHFYNLSFYLHTYLKVVMVGQVLGYNPFKII
jgi:hypothetical protein